MTQNKKIKMYMCGVDYQCELENDYVKIFVSPEELKKNKVCWEECGIVEVELDLTNVKWIEKQDFCRNKVDNKNKN